MPEYTIDVPEQYASQFERLLVEQAPSAQILHVRYHWDEKGKYHNKKIRAGIHQAANEIGVRDDLHEEWDGKYRRAGILKKAILSFRSVSEMDKNYKLYTVDDTASILGLIITSYYCEQTPTIQAGFRKAGLDDEVVFRASEIIFSD